MALCVRTHDSSYQAIVRPLLSSAPLGASRRERREAADRALIQFVHFIEEFCYRTPYQWFNFYDFWAQGNVPESRAESAQP
jgi:predicted LPLAT superfamily acyltransferase